MTGQPLTLIKMINWTELSWIDLLLKEMDCQFFLLMVSAQMNFVRIMVSIDVPVNHCSHRNICNILRGLLLSVGFKSEIALISSRSSLDIDSVTPENQFQRSSIDKTLTCPLFHNWSNYPRANVNRWRILWAHQRVKPHGTRDWDWDWGKQP